MAVTISKAFIDEMTLVGDGFAPRNPKAIALATKAASVSTLTPSETETSVDAETFEHAGEAHTIAPGAPSFVSSVAKAQPDVIPEFIEKGYMVPVKVKGDMKTPAGVDANDHYEAAIRHISGAHYDLQSAMGINSDKARSAAMVATVDSHKKAMDEMYAGKTDVERKAGRALSKDTLTKIAAIQEQIKTANDQLSALTGEDSNDAGAEETTTEPVATPDDAGGTAEEKAMKNVTPAEVPETAAPAIYVPEEKAAGVSMDIEAIVAAVKAGIVIPDNTEALNTITTQLSTLANRIEAVEGTATVAAAKAASNEATLKAAYVTATEPMAVGGIATLMEDGKTYAAPANGGEASQKAAPVTEITPDTSAMDAVLALQRNGRARGNKR